MNLPLVREHTDALIAALEALGLAVGDAEAPEGAPPYVVVYQGWTTNGEPPLGAPYDELEVVHQITCVGHSREQAEWLQDKVAALAGTSLSITGRAVLQVRPEEGSGGVRRDDQVTPPLFYATPRYRTWTRPG